MSLKPIIDRIYQRGALFTRKQFKRLDLI